MRDKELSIYAKENCCNRHNNGCWGAMFDNDLQIKMGTAYEICLVDQNKRCVFFEECVIPGLVGVDNRLEILASYKARFSNGLVGEKYRECETCGTRVGKGRRFCEECRKKRTKQASKARRDLAKHQSSLNLDVLTNA